MEAWKIIFLKNGWFVGSMLIFQGVSVWWSMIHQEVAVWSFDQIMFLFLSGVSVMSFPSYCMVSLMG